MGASVGEAAKSEEELFRRLLDAASLFQNNPMSTYVEGEINDFLGRKRYVESYRVLDGYNFLDAYDLFERPALTRLLRQVAKDGLTIRDVRATRKREDGCVHTTIEVTYE